MVLKVMKLQLTLLQFFQIITTNVVLKLVPLLFGVVALFFLVNFSFKSKKMLLKEVKKNFAV